MPNNVPFVKIEELLNSIFEQRNEITINEIKKIIIEELYVNEMEISAITFYLITENYLEIVKTNQRFENSIVKRNRKIQIENLNQPNNQENTYPQIVVSLPPFNIFGLQTEFSKFNYPIYSLKEGLHNIISKAKNEILICSPFLDYYGIQLFMPTLLKKVSEGVQIRIISRQISPEDPDTRNVQIKKIIQDFGKYKNNVFIRNYHYSGEHGINSSTHAKIVVCDYSLAYVGSGEIRNNSFNKNFELGIIIKGEEARKIGLIFDRIYSVSFDIELKEEDDGNVVY